MQASSSIPFLGRTCQRMAMPTKTSLPPCQHTHPEKRSLSQPVLRQDWLRLSKPQRHNPQQITQPQPCAAAGAASTPFFNSSALLLPPAPLPTAAGPRFARGLASMLRLPPLLLLRGVLTSRSTVAEVRSDSRTPEVMLARGAQTTPESLRRFSWASALAWLPPPTWKDRRRSSRVWSAVRGPWLAAAGVDVGALRPKGRVLRRLSWLASSSDRAPLSTDTTCRRGEGRIGI